MVRGGGEKTWPRGRTTKRPALLGLGPGWDPLGWPGSHSNAQCSLGIRSWRVCRETLQERALRRPKGATAAQRAGGWDGGRQVKTCIWRISPRAQSDPHGPRLDGVQTIHLSR